MRDAELVGFASFEIELEGVVRMEGDVREGCVSG